MSKSHLVWIIQKNHS